MKTTQLNWILAGTFAVAVVTGCGPAKKPASADKPAETPTKTASASSVSSTPDAAPITDLDTDLLKGAGKKELTEGDRAWQTLQKSIEPPSFPDSWQEKQPSKEEVAAFETKNGVLAGEAAQRVKEFYTKYPQHEMAEQAKTMEMGLVNAAVRLGNTNQQTRLRELEEARLKDPKLPEEERFALRAQQLQRRVDTTEKQSRTASLAEMDTGVRELQKEFPKREEVSSLLLAVAQGRLENNETDKARGIVEEVLKSKPAGEVKDEAEALQKKLEIIGKPLVLHYKSLDRHEVDVQKMQNKVVLVDFWATWCGPCMAELPKVKAAYKKLHDKGFEIVGVSLDEDKKALEKVIKSEEIPWAQYMDGEGGPKYAEQFAVTSIPTMWLVDKKGVLRDLFARENLAEKVEKLLAEP
jgi:thiol-disulfide isomerase/thioredoxin